MKLTTYQLCRLCDQATLGRRKWLYLAANLLALIVFALLKLGWLMLPPLLLMNASLALYFLHRHHAFGVEYQRKPRPDDAMCETILIDAALIGEGTRLRAAAQPIDVSDSLSMRIGSGALLLGAAMTLTADELPRTDRAAILSAVNSLNIKPNRLRSHNPVLRREKTGDVTIVTVRDGVSNRQYFVGPAEEVLQCCAAIWEGHSRSLTEQDPLRIADTARYITQGGCRVLAWATALAEEEPVFLGMAGVGESVQLDALGDVADLRARGLTVMLDIGDQPDTDLDSLRALMELPDHHARADIHLSTRNTVDSAALGVTCRPGESLIQPIILLRQRFHTIESTLRHFALLSAIPLTQALIFGSWHAALIATAMLLYTAIALGVDLSRPLPRWQTLAAVAAATLLSRFFLLTQPASPAILSGSIMAVCTAVGCCIRLAGSAFCLKKEAWLTSAPIPAAAGLYALIILLFSLSAGAALFLPLGFSVLMAAVILLLILMEHHIFR